VDGDVDLTAESIRAFQIRMPVSSNKLTNGPRRLDMPLRFEACDNPTKKTEEHSSQIAPACRAFLFL
jgi:hypothetical protein